MLSVLLNSTSEKELKYMGEFTNYIVALLSDEECSTKSILSLNLLLEFLDGKPIIDVACVDVTRRDGLEGAKRVRSLSDNTMIVIIADKNISPVSYICPDIMAASLLLRPFTGKQVKDVLKQTFKSYLRRFKDTEDSEDIFAVDTREGRTLIPYSRIDFFEARDKKIVAVTDSIEYSFYDTIEKLSEELPAQFVRCHRSFIVNTEKIFRIKASENIIETESGEIIPLSRSYKKSVKDATR